MIARPYSCRTLGNHRRVRDRSTASKKRSCCEVAGAWENQDMKKVRRFTQALAAAFVVAAAAHELPTDRDDAGAFSRAAPR
jgi:hypothetical protein